MVVILIDNWGLGRHVARKRRDRSERVTYVCIAIDFCLIRRGDRLVEKELLGHCAECALKATHVGNELLKLPVKIMS